MDRFLEQESGSRTSRAAVVGRVRTVQLLAEPAMPARATAVDADRG
jgi:hypothetical protein